MKLDKFFCSFISVIILFFYIYNTYYMTDSHTKKDCDLIEINKNLRKQIEDNRNKKLSKYFTDAIFDINLMHSHPNTLIDGLYGKASTYFCAIKDENYQDIFNDLNKSSNICRVWSSSTKEKYLQKFEEYNQDVNESNVAIISFNRCTLDGLNIVDDICL